MNLFLLPLFQKSHRNKVEGLFLTLARSVINNNIYLTAIGLSPGGSGFKHIYKYLTLCY